MRSFLWAVSLFSQMNFCRGNTNQSYDSSAQLFDALNISDVGMLAALQDTIQAPRGNDTNSKAHFACAISGIVFNTDNSVAYDIPPYLDTKSDPILYADRTKVSW